MNKNSNTTQRQGFYQPRRSWNQEVESPVHEEVSSHYRHRPQDSRSSSTGLGSSNSQTNSYRGNGHYRVRYGGNRMSNLEQGESWRSNNNDRRWESCSSQTEVALRGNEESERRNSRQSADNCNRRDSFQRGQRGQPLVQGHETGCSRTGTAEASNLSSTQDSTGDSDRCNVTSMHHRDETDSKEVTLNTNETVALGERKTEASKHVELRKFQLVLHRQAALVHDNDYEGWPHIVGSCLDMCPAEEREKRARLRDLAVFERLNGDQSRTSKDLAVKKFCRTFSGKDLKKSDVRPLLVLFQTMEHLMKILDLKDHPFELVHDFLFDRTRAIRQELSMQRIIDEMAVSIYESIVRFHIVSERQLRQQRASGKVFDSHLNFQQLSKALLSLLNLYVVLSTNGHLPNDAEFCCYYVLLNLSQPQQLSLWFQTASPALLESPDVQFSRDVLRCYQQQNYRGFFRLAAKATFLQACLMELYFNEVRATAIQIINYGSYKLHPYPLSELAKMLLMEEEDMEEFCSLHGLAVGTTASNEVQLLSKQAEFRAPKQGLRHYHCQVIEDKRPAKFQELCSANLNIFGG